MTVFPAELTEEAPSRRSSLHKKINVLIVGGGGREHALAWKLKQSSLLGNLYVAPGNAGTADIAKNVPIAVHDIEELVGFAKRNQVGLTIVGPEKPLSLGIVDRFRKAKLPIFGPTSLATIIESDKASAKLLMRERKVSTADFRIFDQYNAAIKYVETIPPLCVIKATGLAGGKGVFICHSTEEAKEAVHKLMSEKVHGQAGNSVVIESFIKGSEASLHAITDGNTYILFPQSQDHKKVRDGDMGDNTGGMGVITPFPYMSPQELDYFAKQTVDPILAGLKERGRSFTGCLYPGLMLTPEGHSVLEYNARFGDPEAQVYMRLMKSDILPLVLGSALGNLGGVKVSWHSGYAICVVLASRGYPEKTEPEKGHTIKGIKEARMIADVEIFHMGTRSSGNGIRTHGGRVLGVTATGNSIEEVRRKVYQAIDLIHFDGMHYRHDIGARKSDVH